MIAEEEANQFEARIFRFKSFMKTWIYCSSTKNLVLSSIRRNAIQTDHGKCNCLLYAREGEFLKFVCKQIDRDTSGLIIVAKNHIQQVLSKQMQQNLIQQYIAIRRNNFRRSGND